MPLPAPLPPEALFAACDPASLGFASTDALADVDAAQIHPRAVEAIRLGLGMHHPGYNLFVVGASGSGRHAMVSQLLENDRRDGPPPSDWCYVNNFAEPSRPALLALPCGRGAGLRDDMQHFVAELIPAISAVFESDEYRSRIDAMQEDEKRREETAFQALGHEAATQGVALLRTPHGFALVPLKDDESTLTPDEFAQLPEARQQEFEEHIKTLREQLHKLTGEFPRWRRELQARIKQAGGDALRVTVTHLVDELKARHADLPAVVAYLDAVLQDIVECGETLRDTTHVEDDSEVTTYAGTLAVQRYLINLLVENATDGSRPVIVEDHPTLQNLVGRVEHVVHMGTLMSNFTLVRAGALQRANGGYLVLDAIKVLSQPYAWDGLKRCLKANCVRIESLSDLLGLSSTVQIEPEPIPLDLKVVLVGERMVYFLLCQFDPEFSSLFKINADLESELVRNADNTAAYARLIATLARRDGLRPLDADAVARLIEHAARLSSDAERLTTHTQPLDDLMREADREAAVAGAPHVGRAHVVAALDAHRRRHALIAERYRDEILRGQLLVDTAGRHAGQVNGLAVIPLGDASFAHPARITATVRVGDGEVVDIEREVKLGGPIHSKGVLILSAFVATRFGRDTPLSLRASLVFEQSYGGVEGDSASLAELLALLSAIGGLPLDQGIAVTGSVNQFGNVQPVGGINEKIEGFFDICAARGLTGTQGVVIPAANTCHLMLRDDVLAAARDGHFHVWPVGGVDDALALVAGIDAAGASQRITAGLRELAARRRAFQALKGGKAPR